MTKQMDDPRMLDLASLTQPIAADDPCEGVTTTYHEDPKNEDHEEELAADAHR